MTAPRAALYARVSTRGQVSTDPWASLPQQLVDLGALAVRLGFVAALVVEEQGSGAKADRPGWNRILAAARAGEVDVICAVAFDRLTRSERLGDFEDLKRELRGLGVRLVTVKQGEIDLSGSADAETMSDVQAVLSKRERIVIRERTTKGREAKAAAGGFPGGKMPYGYVARFHPTTGKRFFEIKEDEAAVVREVFRRYLAGEGGPRIADYLTALGVPPPRGPVDPSRPVAWVRRTVERMVRSPAYAGLQNWRPDKFTGVVSLDFPPLVDMETWRAAQQEVAVRRVRAPRGGHPPHPLSGILRCATCGTRTEHATVNRRGYYCCAHRPGAKSGVTCPKAKHLYGPAAEAAVLAFLVEHVPRYLEHGPAATPKRVEAAAARLARELAKVQAESARLVDELLRVGDGPAADIYRRTLAEKGDREKALAAQLAEARQERERDEHPLPLPDWLAVAGALAAAPPAPATLRTVFETFVLQTTVARVSRHMAVPIRMEVLTLQLTNGVWLKA